MLHTKSTLPTWTFNNFKKYEGAYIFVNMKTNAKTVEIVGLSRGRVGLKPRIGPSNFTLLFTTVFFGRFCFHIAAYDVNIFSKEIGWTFEKIKLILKILPVV